MKPDLARRARRALVYLAGCIGAGVLIAACGDTAQEAQTGQQLATRASVSAVAAAATADLEVTALQKVGEKRITRTEFEYTYKVSVRNNSAAAVSNVVATLTSVPKGTQIIDATVAAGAIGAGATVTPAADVMVLRQDRTIAFEPASLGWTVSGDPGGQTIVELDEAMPADLVVIPLEELELPASIDKVTVTGAVSQALIRDGTLRFSTPGDTGVDQEAEFLVSGPSGSSKLHLWIRTQRPTAVVAHEEKEESGKATTTPPLTITGLGAGNTLGSSALNFKMSGVGQLDLKDMSDAFITVPGNAKIGLKPFWTFNPADSSFTISSANMQQLLAMLPNGSLNIDLNFVSKYSDFAAGYEMLAAKSSATLTGRLVTSTGGLVTAAAGKPILLQGVNSDTRKVAIVDASGNFTFTGVLPDTYEVVLADLEAPFLVSGTTAIFATTTQATMNIVYATLPGSATAMLSAQAAKSGGAFVAGSTKQDGKAPAARSEAPSAGLASAPSVSAAATGVTVFSVTSGAQSAPIGMPIVYSIPIGTQTVGVKATVTTAEYPVYTGSQSQYNDTWRYVVFGLPGVVFNGSGAVNKTHVTQGTVTRTSCINVSEATKTAPLALSGLVQATNIGDSAFPTTTTVELSLGCLDLVVTSAKFTSPNAAGLPVLEPKNKPPNLKGPYVSIPRTAPDATYTLPLVITFKPANAVISEINIGLAAVGGEPVFSAENLLQQAPVITPGMIKFKKLSMPAFSGDMQSGKVGLTIRLKGSLAGSTTTSNPAQGGQIRFANTTAFTPLYLAGSLPSMASRRYGQPVPPEPPEAGGDSWATKQSIDWLGTNGYLFNDISAQNIAQTPEGRSILDHSGHSDGQTFDLRYADGQGGYTGTLNGAGDGAAIKALIDAAQLEVAAGNPNGPRVTRLRAWINANRAMLLSEAAVSGVRRIYVGDEFIARSLVQGRFDNPPYNLIPLLNPWVMPTVIKIAPGHLHHWHISRTAQP